MKTSVLFILLALSIVLVKAQGIRPEKLGTTSARNHQELVTKRSSSDQGEEYSSLATELSSGINRKLMTKIVPSSSTTINKKDPGLDQKFTHGLVGKEELFHTTWISDNSEDGRTEIVSKRYTDVTDITTMDYTPAKKKPPIHN
ncbi:hypothetical protein CTI12_AA243840 [Artemisia annua]|uniref:Uncharacterized protein n=1 Tax=Artemisia annua TaxID=35608 RepID=A0A2U1NP87_ARTAN|nr:hypothetical protein CTI12_AA243840 [Artemisia annua]